MRKRITAARRVVVKLGSNTLGAEGGGLDVACVTGLAGEIVEARRAGLEIVIVSSGAILAGRGRLGVNGKNSELDIAAKQALAWLSGRLRVLRRPQMAASGWTRSRL